MSQGVLPFKYEEDRQKNGMTALAGLPSYLELAKASGLVDSISRHLKLRDQGQGWTDRQLVVSLVLLNLAGGDCVEDLKILEADGGFNQLLRRVELHGLRRKRKRELERRWRKVKKRAVPSPSSVFRYLSEFHDAEQEKLRAAGKSFIPKANAALQGFNNVNKDLVAFKQQRTPQSIATIDQDATISETHKRDALYSYKGKQSYQPLNTWWAEQEMVLHTEFRDGNVYAGYEQLRVFKEALANLPEGVETVRLRSDTAGYQHELLRYCEQGKNERFGRIEFAISSDVTDEFKKAVNEVAEGDWQPYYREKNQERIKTDYEWAEVCFVPSEVAKSKHGTYRYLALRQAISQQEIPGLESELPFPNMPMGGQRYKLFGMVTNMDWEGSRLIQWQHERCGKSEEAHSVMKSDLAGGKFPSGDFGENAAWWWVMILALNLNSLMKQLVLGKEWVPKRMKAIRYHIINLPGRVITTGHEFILRLSGGHPSNKLLLRARERIKELLRPPQALAMS